MLDKKIVYTLKQSYFNKLKISVESEGTAIVFTSNDEYDFTLSISEIKELQNILKDVINEIEIIEDMKKDKEIT
jgi:hypothetical protein